MKYKYKYKKELENNKYIIIKKFIFLDFLVNNI
jgi:hypothetical protein